MHFESWRRSAQFRDSSRLCCAPLPLRRRMTRRPTRRRARPCSMGGRCSPEKDSRLGDVLVVNGIDIGYWSHAAEIDAALSNGAFAKQPIVLFGSDGHTAWANRP